MKNKKVFTLIIAILASLPLMAGEGGGTLTHKMLLLTLQVGVIIFAAKLGGMIASLLKLPSVLGELGIGVAIGPYALGGMGFGDGLFAHGIIPPALDAAGNVASIPITPELYGLCTIASIILLFLSGLETNLKLFLKYAFAGSLVGIGGVVASFLLGDLATIYLLPRFLPASFGEIAELASTNLMSAIMHPAALFMGIMSTATSVGITARILSERRQMDSAEGVTIMAGAVIDDVLGIIVLAIGMGVIASQVPDPKTGVVEPLKWKAIGTTAAQAFGVWLGGTALGLVIARRLSWLLKLFRSPVAIATMALGLALVIAGVFESLGLSMIIGAYVMGLALSRTDIRYIVQENLQPVYTFLVPIFFCVMGMMVDCSQLCSKPVLIFGGIYTLLAIIAKICGCALPSLFCGFNAKGALRVGAGMIPRGEVALIIAGLGLSTTINGKPILTQETFGIGIMMTLITTVLAPPMLVGMFNLKGRGVKDQRPNTDNSRPITFAMQTPAAAELMMDKLIRALRENGFLACLVNPDENIWQLSKDSAEINMCRKGSELIFECTPTEQTFIATAIIEVSSELSSLAHDLSRPIKNGQLAAILKEGENGPSVKGSFGMMRYARHFVMVPDLEASSPDDAIVKLVAILKENGRIDDEKTVLAAIRRREEAMPTGLDHGLAVPHGRTDSVDGLVGAVAIVRNPNGIPGYETIDNAPVRIVVLTVSSESNATPHLQLLAHISRRLRDENRRRELLACDNAADMLKFISKE